MSDSDILTDTAQAIRLGIGCFLALCAVFLGGGAFVALKLAGVW